MTGHTKTRKQEQGFAVLQAIIVFAIVATVAAIALPVYASKAKDVVLLENAQNLELQVKSCLALDLDSDFCPDGDADDGFVSTALGSVLRSRAQGDAGRFVNPLTGSSAIVCQSEPPHASGDTAPAVWITDDKDSAYEALADSDEADASLAGTLLVVFQREEIGTSAIEVFFVDRDGRRSADVATLVP